MMSRIIIRIGIGVVAATVLAAIVGLFLPSKFVVEKEVVVKASPETIHEFVGDMAQWTQWNPWLQEDPNQVVTSGETTTGPGASQSWEGGASDGHMSFTSCNPASGVSYEMTFKKNSYTSTGSLLYRPVADGTEVFWHMTGDSGNNIMARYFIGLMPSLVGPQFEEGLARLKLISEKAEAQKTAVPEG